MKRFISSLILVLILPSCSEKAEEEKFNELSEGLAYTSYKEVSSRLMPVALKTFQQQHRDSLTIPAGYGHVVLGLFWIASDRPTYGLAEANLAEETDSSADVKYMAQSLRRMVMYSQGLDSLARRSQRTQRNSAPEAKLLVTIYSFTLASERCHGGNFSDSKILWLEFAANTGVVWPYELADALAAFENDNYHDGLVKLKNVSENPKVPDTIRGPLRASIRKIEAETGDLVSPSFWSGVVTKVIVEELKKSTNQQFAAFVQMIEDVKGNIDL